MRKSFIIPVVFPLLLTACGKQEKSEQPSLMEASKQELADAIAERDELLSLMSQIAESMEDVKHIENIVISSDTGNNDFKGYDRSGILLDITEIQNTLKQRRRRLVELEKNLEDTTLGYEDLKKAMCSLRKQIDSQSKTVTNLKKQVSNARSTIDSLNRKVDSLNTRVATVSEERDNAISESRRIEDKINTCFYVVASQKELKKHNIIETSFLRPTKLTVDEVDNSFFTESDKRQLHSINLNSEKFKIYSRHPSESYEIIEQNRNKILHIKNPDKFWSLTNHLIIQID